MQGVIHRDKLSTCRFYKLNEYNITMKENTLFKITDEALKRFTKLFESDDFKGFMSAMKADKTTDNGTFRMVISTDNIDRHGEVVSQDGWQTENYMKNAVVLWGHDSYSLPVGITDRLLTEISGTNKSTIAEGRFAGHEFAQTIRKMYDAGMVKASSVGFIPLEYDGNRITKAELLEWSFVSIPANPFALDTLKTLGLDATVMLQKGFLKEMKEGEETTTETNTDTEKKDDETVEVPADVNTDTEETEEATDAVVNETEKTITMTLVDGSKKTYKLPEIQKAGRVLSKANLNLVISAKEALEAVIELASTQIEEDKTIDDKSERANAQDIQEAEDFLKIRRGVQNLATLAGSILADAKVDASKRGINVR